MRLALTAVGTADGLYRVDPRRGWRLSWMQPKPRQYSERRSSSPASSQWRSGSIALIELALGGGRRQSLQRRSEHGRDTKAALIAGTALSTTSLAVVHGVVSARLDRGSGLPSRPLPGDRCSVRPPPSRTW